MKEVLGIYVKGKFHQYLLKSEARYIAKHCESFGEVTVKLEKITVHEYKIHFGKI